MSPPNIYMKGDVNGNVPQYTVVCCILMQILCVVSQKDSASGGRRPPSPLLGLRPWTPLGDFRPPDL